MDAPETGLPPQPQPVSPVSVAPEPKRGGAKKIILIVVTLLILAGLGFFVYKFVLPRLVTQKEVELTWWGIWEEESVVAPLIEEYQAQNPKVKIKYVKESPQDYRERLTNAIARGEGPDIFRIHNSWVPMFKNELDNLPASVMSAAEFSQTFYPVAATDLTSGTGLLGIPLEYDGLALYINEDIFNSSGKSPPVTWDDLRALASELTVRNDQGNITQAGVALGTTANVDHWPEILALMLLQNKVNLIKPNECFNKPGASGADAKICLGADALGYFARFTNTDRAWDATLPPSTIAFSSGKVAMYFGPSWRAFEIKLKNPNLKFKTVPLPQVAKSDPKDPNTAYATYWVEGVWARGENKEAAWNFLKFLSTKESLTKLYENAAKIRLFGQPYPRIDMADLLKDEAVIGSIIQAAPDAQSWYLQTRTFDGPTGINSQVNKYFEDAVNAVNSGTSAEKALDTTAKGVSQVLGQYGLVSR